MNPFEFLKLKQSKDEEIQENEQAAIEAEVEEEKTVVGQRIRYRGVVVDKDGNILLKKNGNPYCCNVYESEQKPKWPKEWMDDEVIKNKADRVDEELRIEFGPKDDKKKVEIELTKRAKERIAAAEAMQNPAESNGNGSEQVIDPKLQEVPKTQPEEQADTVKTERVSAPEQAAEEAPVPEKKENETIREASAVVDLSAVTSCIEGNIAQLSEDLKNDIEDLLQTIGKDGEENSGVIKSYVEAQAKRICDTTLRVASDVDRDITQKTQKYADNIVSRVNENGRSIGESQEKLLSKVNGVGKRVTDLGESVEGIEGKLSRLEQIDEIAELLRDKGLTISRDIPPVNADEEDIINLVRYSQKITEQLGYAARDLIRKQEAFKSQEESNANEQRMMEQKIAKAHAEGVEEGKKVFVKQLLSKYEDVDTIRESDNNHVHAIWTLLMELGVSINGEGYYEKGKEIELAASDIEKMIGTYSKLEDAGKYRVVRTGLCFQGEILCKAAFEKVTETAEPEAPKAEENPETGKEEGEPEATSEEAK